MAPITSSFLMPVFDQPALSIVPAVRSDFDILTDQSTSVEILAQRFKFAFLDHEVAQLNAVIRQVVAQKGQFKVPDQVKRLLLEDSIELNQSDDGQISMCRYVHSEQDNERFKAIQGGLTDVIPASLVELVSAYDEQVMIHMDNKQFIIETLRSTDRAMQRQIFECAIAQGQKDVLSEILTDRCWNFRPLNLSEIDLSNLDLSDLQMKKVILNNANLSATNLRNIDLTGAVMGRTNLSLADMTGATLNDANLLGAVLIGALLGGAEFENATLDSADLTGANLTGCDFSSADLTKANLTDTGLSDEE